MELKDTIKLMNSSDYKERFIAEYQQVKIRFDKLKNLLNKWDAYSCHYRQEKTFEEYLGFTPTCSFEVLKRQLAVMGEYLHLLELRAKVENIEL